MRKILKNKIFWKNLGFLIILILVMLDDPNYWKSLFFIDIILSYPLPKLKRCFRTDLPQKPLPSTKGEYDYKNGKLIFTTEKDQV